MSNQLAAFDYQVTPKVVPYGSGAVTLLLAVGNNTGAFLDCTQIVFTVPDTLTTDPGSITASSLDPDWGFVGGGAANQFVATPYAPTQGLKNGESFGLELSGIKVVETVGLPEIEVDETTSDGLGQKWLRVMTAAPGLAITKFSADCLSPAPGQAVTFSWVTTAATTVTLSYDGGNHTVAPTGKSDPIKPAQTMPFTLTATGAGPPASETITVTVDRVEMTSIDAKPLTVPQGGQTTLSWSAIFAESFTITPGAIQLPATAGSHTVTVPEQDAAEVIFQVIANGTGGTNNSLTQVISLEPVEISSFSAAPALVQPGGSSTLTWSTKSATSCEILPDPGFAVGTNGQGAATVSVPTTYRLRATGNGHVEQPVTVDVGAILTSFGVNFDPANPSVATMTWSSAGATTVSFFDSPDNPIPVDPTGSRQISIPTSSGYAIEYDLVIEGSGTKVKAALDISWMTNGSKSVTSFQVASATGVTVGFGEATLSWTGQTQGDAVTISGDDFHGNSHEWNGEPSTGSVLFPLTDNGWLADCFTNSDGPGVGLQIYFNV